MRPRPGSAKTALPAWKPRFLLLLLMALPASADAIRTADGSILVGRILEATDEGVRIEVDGAEVFLEVTRLDPGSFQQVRTRTIAAGDADGRYRLGRFCQTHGLWMAARDEYLRAAAIDPARSERVRLRIGEVESAHGQSLFESALEAHRSGDPARAAEALVRLLEIYPGHRFAGPAWTALAACERELAARRAERTPEARERKERVDAAQKGQERTATALARAEALLGAARQAGDEAEAAAAERLVTKAARAFEKADQTIVAAGTKLVEARRACRDAKETEDLDRRIAAAQKERARLALARARFAAGQGNWKEAAEANRLAMACDPTNEDARAFQSEIDRNYVTRSLKKWTNAQDRVR